MAAIDIEVIRHASGNKSKTVYLSLAHLLEYLRMKRVKLPPTRELGALSVKLRLDDHTVIDLCNEADIEIRFLEIKP